MSNNYNTNALPNWIWELNSIESKKNNQENHQDIYHEPYNSNQINCLLRQRRKSMPNISITIPILEGSTFMSE